MVLSPWNIIVTSLPRFVRKVFDMTDKIVVLSTCSNEEEGESHAPSNSTPPTKDSPFVFPLSETLKRLDAATPTPTGQFGTQVELGNPAMDTIGLHMMRLAPKVKTAPYRTTANNMYAVVKGSGATTIDGQRFEWRRGDVIAAPAWRPHFHEAAINAAVSNGANGTGNGHAPHADAEVAETADVFAEQPAVFWAQTLYQYTWPGTTVTSVKLVVPAT
jgi:mannose-6-phosphate isomerase-like protein (cupin superfamily)